MGRHVSRALLMASRPEGWELMEKTLLAAQRQEGLRQVVLETVDEAHPEAYRRMLRLIRDHDLARFSAVVRAVNVWFGMNWDSASVKVVNAAIDRVLGFLDDPSSRDKALTGRDQEAIFLALWSVAFSDALAAIPLAAELLKDKKTEIRFVATLHLGQLALPQTTAALISALDDEDLRVADCACRAWPQPRSIPPSGKRTTGLFAHLERLFQRFPRKPVELKPLDCPWGLRKISQERGRRADGPGAWRSAADRAHSLPAGDPQRPSAPSGRGYAGRPKEVGQRNPRDTH